MRAKIKQHNIVERTIKSDIIRKNRLRKELLKQIHLVTDWTDQLNRLSNIRRRKKLLEDIDRYLPEIKEQKQILTQLIDSLQKRIKQEMKYSEKEIADLEASHKKEYKEMVKAQKLLAKTLNSKLSDEEKSKITGVPIEQLLNKEQEKKVVFPKELLLAKVNKQLNREKKQVKEVEKELASEAKDKTLFQKELKRMILEQEILK
jgi:hypothetical protein